MGWKTRRKPRSEQGAVAIIVAALTIVLLGVAALGVDLASQVSRKHLLINQLDSAATAAAYEFGRDGSIADAVDAATTFFADNGREELDLHEVDFWCVVARKLNGDGSPLTPAMVADYQIPTRTQGVGTCNPDAASNPTTWQMSPDYQNRLRPWDDRRFSMTCSNALCAVPCALNASPDNGWNPGVSAANDRDITCNTIRVGAEQDVPFSFAPVLGIDEGSTGSQVSVACAGACGEVAPNPLDVAVVADRTLSMSANRGDLVEGIKSMFEVMTPEQQYVALGALGPSVRTRTNSESYSCNSSGQGLVYPSSNPSTQTTGAWVPLPFKKDYLNSPDSLGRRSINTSSKLVQAVNCLSSTSGDSRLGQTGTALASPLKAAVRYLLGKPGDENNITSLGGANRSGDVRKVIIFETDGEPQEPASTTSATISLDNDTDIFSNYRDNVSSPTVTNNSSSTVTGRPSGVSQPSGCTDSGSKGCNYQTTTATSTRTTTTTWGGGQQACRNVLRVAELAKQQGILIITIGYGLGGALCGDGNNGSGGLPSNTDQTVTTGTAYISAVSPNTSTCRSGSGTPSNPYVPRKQCGSKMTVTWSGLTVTRTLVDNVQAADNPPVTDVLANVSGGNDMPTSTSNGCTNDALISAENSDDDLFFCAARGDDLAPLFVSALGSVTSGVKLIRLP